MKNFEKAIEKLKDNTNSPLLKNLRKIILEGFHEGLKSVDPEALIRKNVLITKDTDTNNINLKIRGFNGTFNEEMIINLNDFQSVLIIGGGKATFILAETLIKILGIHLKCYGLINIPHGQNMDEEISFSSGDINSKIEINYSAHPIPDINGLEGTKKMVDLVHKAKQSKDNILIFILISGGGSALMPLPKSGIELKDLQEINSLLIKSGADINEINSVRKHISEFKGGNLAKVIYPKKAITLIISDVVGDSMDVIASGPTVPDNTTFTDAYNVFIKYNILKKIPENVKKLISTGMNGKVNENPKKTDLIFQSIKNLIIGSAETAKNVMIRFFEKNKFENLSHLLKWGQIQPMKGEARNYGKYVADMISKVSDNVESIQPEKISYMINSGELTVTIQGDGIGGRNQEMLLSFINELDISCLEKIDFVVCSMAFDGIEGNSPAAGAIVDSSIFQKIKTLKLNPFQYLKNNDSYNFFKKINDTIEIGQTGTNINDIICVFIREKNKSGTEIPSF